MTTVIEIEKAIERLPSKEYSKLRGWIEDHDLENDLAASSAGIASMLDDEDGGENQLVSE